VVSAVLRRSVITNPPKQFLPTGSAC
jgi:hypothetical protein